MPEITFNVNGASVTIDAENDDELLYLLRDRLGITGPKYGCGVGVCGACTIFQDDQAVRPCIVPMEEAAGSDLTTIEGLAVDDVLHPVQQALVDEDVAQCGYCQAGQIMTAVKLLERIPQPTDADIDEAMRENVCRCGTYYRIRRAIKRASGQPVSPPQGASVGVVDDGVEASASASTEDGAAVSPPELPSPSSLPGTVGDTASGLVGSLFG